ncbi:hypothetical protein [Pseudomonas sp. NPDC090592]|uniref:hypothetical protein n=1 Tax=Pseudomonas sp. NPDC090592 TaxID=3364480 RepID=UPI00383B68FC
MACERQGLPILPLRRALVPDTRPQCLTTVAGSLHISAKLGVRTLRMRYLYVLLDHGSAWLAFSSDPWPVGVLNAYKKGQAPAHRFEGLDLSQARNNPELLGMAMTPNNLQVERSVRIRAPVRQKHGQRVRHNSF